MKTSNSFNNVPSLRNADSMSECVTYTPFLIHTKTTLTSLLFYLQCSFIADSMNWNHAVLKP